MAPSLWARLRELDPDPSVLSSADEVKRWIVTASVFARASKEVDAKRKFDPSSMRVEDDGAVVGTCAGSRPEDAYDVRVRVRGKDGSDASDGADGAAEVEHEAPIVDVSCTCPAAKAHARGGAPTGPGPPQFGARTAVPPKAQPPRSCKHSAALLLWRARTLAADVDPDASRAETTAATRTTTTERPDERPTETRAPERDEAASPRAPPPRPAAAAPRAKRRRLPPSLAQSAAAAAEAAAKRAKRPAGETLNGGLGDNSVRERAKEKEKDEEKVTSVSRNQSAARATVKHEPGQGVRAATNDANGRTTTIRSGDADGASPADREIVAKVQTIGDAALLDAARRAMLGESATESSAANENAIRAATSSAARDVSVSVAAARDASRAASPPPRAQMSAAPAMKDMFASFLPAAFKAPASAPAASAPASAPAPAPAAGDASLEKTQPAGPARPVSIAKPAALPAVAPSAGGAVSTGAVGGDPAAEVSKGGPKKMSFAELMASGL